jgi:hypothetical protein
VKVRISAPAKVQSRAISAWWRKNRQASPELFAREMAEARRLLSRTPELGAPYLERDGVLVRRILLRNTRHHVYYEIDRANGVVMILAVWGTPKINEPSL